VYCDEAIFYIIMEILVCTPRQDGITHTFLFVFLSFRNQNIVLLFPLVKPIDPCTFGVALFPPLAPDISKKLLSPPSLAP